MQNYSVSKMTDDCVLTYELTLRRQHNIVISGYYGFKNAGDEAILQSICRSISDSDGDISITVLSSDPADTTARCGYHAVDMFKIFRVLKALRRCDVLLSGGGSLLQDSTSTRSILYYLFIICVAKCMGKKVMIYANGIGPVNKSANRRRVRRVVSRADIITLRDAASLDELLEMGVTCKDMRVTADPVFTMSGKSPDESFAVLEKHGIARTPFVTVSIRPVSGTAMDEFCRKIAAVCDGVIEKSGCNILFIPMQTDKDTEISKKVQSMMNHQSCILDSRLAAEELMGIIGVSDAMLGMRLHALIFATRMNVPFVGLVYDPKVAALADTLAMPSAGDVNSLDADSLLETMLQTLSRRDEYSDTLKNEAAALEAAAKENSELLLTLLR